MSDNETSGLLTDEQWLKRYNRHTGLRLRNDDRREQLLSLFRFAESAARAPLLAEIERLTAERDAALSALRKTIQVYVVGDLCADRDAETDRRMEQALKEAANG